MSCATGGPTAWRAADAIAARLTKRAVLTGRLAVIYKELVCKSASWVVANPTLGLLTRLPTRRRRVTRQPPAAGSTSQAAT